MWMWERGEIVLTVNHCTYFKRRCLKLCLCYETHMYDTQIILRVFKQMYRCVACHSLTVPVSL